MCHGLASFFLIWFHPLFLFFLQLNKQQLQLLKERFQAFLNGETQIVADEAFCNAVRSYYEVSLKSFVSGILMSFKRCF